jgi:hypothetical protein
MAFTSAEDELKARFEIVKSFVDTAKSYIQISSAGLALPLLFTQAIFGKSAENGLKNTGSTRGFLYGAWFCFLLAIGFGLIYQWLSVRRVWDDHHEMVKTDQNKDKPGIRFTVWVPHFPDLNLSIFYGGMVVFFFVGVVFFVWFAATILHS